MALTAGTRVGPYEILAPIGAGGMGEVYRARDTKLDRDVAIKVLPAAFAQDPERLARFEREAKVLASLNHPNIATIYGVEEWVGGRALVMELVPGESLKGPLPLQTALDYAKQIADALEAAHEKGIVHRDLKPANIMITPDGVVKVLDFGLAAVAVRQSSDLSNPVNSPTLTISPTRAGMILGTAAYMSPEQARGKAVDKRADIWAFGVVLYGMLTGQRLFDGETVSDTLAQVLTKEPDWQRVPAKVRRLLEACLQKDPKRRLQAIGDWRLLLADLQPQVNAPSQRLTWVLATAAVALAIALAAVSFLHFRGRPSAPVLVRFQVADPALNPGDMAPSPDGRALAYTGVGPDAARRLWIRSFDSLDSRVLPGTEGASSPFWSPDGRFIGFAEGPRLKKIDSSGVAPPETLCDIGNGTVGPGSWNSEGVIIFGGGGSGPLRRVSADGGTATEITALSEGEINHTDPAWLPDGRHFLYTRITPNQPAATTYLGSLDAKVTEQRNHRVLLTESRFVPAAQSGTGYLLFLRGTTLMAQPFDTNRLELAGAPAPVAAQVGAAMVYGFFASSPAALVYRTGAGQIRQLAWYDRKRGVCDAWQTLGEPPRATLKWNCRPMDYHARQLSSIQTINKISGCLPTSRETREHGSPSTRGRSAVPSGRPMPAKSSLRPTKARTCTAKPQMAA